MTVFPEGLFERWSALRRLAGSPRRPLPDHARYGVQETSSAELTFHALLRCGVFPAGWADDRRRRFHAVMGRKCPRCYGLGGSSWTPGEDLGPGTCDACDDTGVEQIWTASAAAPADLETCFALAADVPGVEQAEALAREAMRRLGPWGLLQSGVVLWRSGGVDPSQRKLLPYLFTDHLERSVGYPNEPARDLAHRLRLAVLDVDSPGYKHRAEVSYVASYAALWGVLTATGAEVRGEDKAFPLAWTPPKEIIGRPFSELPDPFEPLYSLFVSGYVLEAIREQGLALRPSRGSSEIERETAR